MAKPPLVVVDGLVKNFFVNREKGSMKASLVGLVKAAYSHGYDAGLRDAKASIKAPPYTCRFCGAPSWYEPIDQTPPADYCHESDHGSPDEEDS